MDMGCTRTCTAVVVSGGGPHGQWWWPSEHDRRHRRHASHVMSMVMSHDVGPGSTDSYAGFRDMSAFTRGPRVAGCRHPPRPMWAVTTKYHGTTRPPMTHADYRPALRPPPSDLVEFGPPPAAHHHHHPPSPHWKAPEPCEERVYTKERPPRQSGSVI